MLDCAQCKVAEVLTYTLILLWSVLACYRKMPKGPILAHWGKSEVKQH